MQLRNIMLVAGAASFSTRDVWDGYRLAFKRLGIDVVPYPTFSMLRMLSPELIGNDIIGKALDVRNHIDAAVFIDGLYFRNERAWIPETLHKSGIPTILLATDDPYDALGETEGIYTIRCSNEFHCACDGTLYLPTAASEPPVVPHPNREYDLLFIGTVFEDRWPLLKRVAHYCERERIRFLIAGHSLVEIDELADLDCVTVKHETVPPVAKWRLYAGVQAVLNVFRESDQPADSPNPRVFEVTAVGSPALLSGPTRSEVTRLFGDSVYQFDGFESLAEQLRAILTNDEQRQARVERAKEITLSGHTYRHRVGKLLTQCQRISVQTPNSPAIAAEARFPIEDRIGWIFGCARTGSTWLNEMLGDIRGIHSWHEPYFGRLFRHLHERPDELERPQSFYYSGYSDAWTQGIRNLFFGMIHRRFSGALLTEALVVKEVNTPEFYSFVESTFPSSRFILLVRHPFDILDSFLDMQKPGSWNKTYSHREESSEVQAQAASESICRALRPAIAAFEDFPESQRLMVRYEDLVAAPAHWIRMCASLLSIDVSRESAERVAARHSFDTYEKTGQLEFHRYGRPDVWRDSENFTAPVRAIAEELLGSLREKLHYPL